MKVTVGVEVGEPGVFVFVKVEVEVGVSVGWGEPVKVELGATVPTPIVMTAPLKGSPVKATVPGAFKQVKAAELAMVDW